MCLLLFTINFLSFSGYGSHSIPSCSTLTAGSSQTSWPPVLRPDRGTFPMACEEAKQAKQFVHALVFEISQQSSTMQFDLQRSELPTQAVSSLHAWLIKRHLIKLSSQSHLTQVPSSFFEKPAKVLSLQLLLLGQL